jgi:rhodanese-related sulfurtransferase
MSEDEFVDAVTGGQTVAPLYFGFAAAENRRVHELLDDHAPPPLLGADELEAWLDKGAAVVDGRAVDEFACGHVRSSINVGMDGRFAEYAGDVVRPGQPIVVVADRGRETEAKVRLARIGFDGVVGAAVDVERLLLERPSLASASRRVAAADLAGWIDDHPEVVLVDVRNPAELDDGVIDGARSIPVAQLLDRMGELDPLAPTIVYCAGGYRSSIAASLLQRHGFTQVGEIAGGIAAWDAGTLPLEV